MAEGCGPFTDLPSHLKHILRSFPGTNALLVITSLSFPAPAEGTDIAGPKKTFEMLSTKSEALIKRRGLSMTPEVSSRRPKETSRSRMTGVGRHDAMLLLSSGTTNLSELVINAMEMNGHVNDLEDSEYPRTVGRLWAQVFPSQFRNARSYRSRHRLPF